jgi:hypothetical protein
MTNNPSDKRLGKYISRDVELLEAMGWEALVRERRGRGDLTTMTGVNHPAQPLLKQLSAVGAPAVIGTAKWSADRLAAAIRRGPHQSCNDQHEFLEEEFADFVEKAQWIVLPYSKVKDLKHL